MRPCTTKRSTYDSVSINSISSSKDRAHPFLINCTNLQNISIIQLRCPIPLPARPSVQMIRRASPPLVGHIMHIICVIPKKQMFRFHTRGIVAGMKNLMLKRNRTNMQPPRETVGKYPFRSSAVRFSNPAVPFIIRSSVPYPTAIRLFEMGIEPLFDAQCSALITTGLTTISPLTFVQNTQADAEKQTALLARCGFQDG